MYMKWHNKLKEIKRRYNVAIDLIEDETIFIVVNFWVDGDATSNRIMMITINYFNITIRYTDLMKIITIMVYRLSM